MVGVFKDEIRPVMAEALQRLGSEKAWGVWGEGGLDEMNLSGKTWVSEVTSSGIQERVVEPEEAGMVRCDIGELKGGDAQDNAKILLEIFSGRQRGPILEGVLYNAGAALCVADKTSSIREGVAMARKAVESGKAMQVLEGLKNFDERPRRGQGMSRIIVVLSKF